ncbi:hypothetical protein DES53_12216 [Roseimicrobium gellanilyticum]|uniref:Uncharacterized protein n=1 Tax=Roseimicrobium gellanilyticum TaxID=748857 RepID=A0A366H0H4_9BACT|nr:hypothetical protein [Roseimicrobium gellanilyticum]RBP35349.1 hypothetical protein DES53_12216 [Roseimicrobium gellanilyticum]
MKRTLTFAASCLLMAWHGAGHVVAQAPAPAPTPTPAAPQPYQATDPTGQAAAATAPVPVGKFETPPVLVAPAILQPQYHRGAYHTVRPQVSTYAGRNSYTIDSQFGVFYAEGNAELMARVAEINAIAKLQSVSKSDEYAKALERAAKSPVTFAKNLATDPVNTIEGVPKGIFKFLHRTGAAVKEKVEGRETSPYEDNTMESAIGFSKSKRDLAARLGVDPYSSNPVFQKAINGVAWAAYAGNMTLAAVLAPVDGGAGTVVTTVQVSDVATNALRDMSPNDLRQMHKKTLLGMGVSEPVIDGFLRSRAFSPTHQLSLVTALSQLKGTAGPEWFLQTATRASDDEADAFFYTRSAQLMALQHKTTPIATIYTLNDLPVCFARDGTLIVPLEWDYACWTQGASDFLQRVRLANYRGAKVTGHRVVITGVASPKLKEELAKQQVVLIEKALPGPLL